MDSDTGKASKALVLKRKDTDLMPAPPPVKKIRRPKKVLDEDAYTETLSHIIARDFFPGLLETETQQEYLDALESKDAAWISSAGRRLQHVMTPGRRKTLSTPRRPMDEGGQTPTTFVGDTPASAAPSLIPHTPRLDANMSLSKFQATYTSEDNESFYQLIDKQNQKKADKYAWLWRGNKLPSKMMLKQKEISDKIAENRTLVDDGFKRDRLAIKDKDDRPARPDAWKAAPRNGLMFEPDDLDDAVMTQAQHAEQISRAAPRSINYANTRVPQPNITPRPPSPTMSSIRDAIAGKPRQNYQDSSVAGGGETPRVNGYAFVDDEEDEAESIAPSPPIDLGPGDTNNPFKIQGQRDRELLHERMVDRIARSNKEASRHGMVGKVRQQDVPKFPSSPRVSGSLTPAAQRLWRNMSTPKGSTPTNSFGQPTPRRSKGSLLRSAARPKTSKDD